MANSNFGFNFGFGKRDDGNDDNNDFSGGIGDFLNDLGQMLSGLGSSMNSSDGESVVLRPGDVVIMDNLSVHKSQAACDAIQARHA